MAGTTRYDWLEVALALLEEVGSEALTIELLTRRLGVTKGSFYHHFKNYQNLKAQVLAFYEEERTPQIIQLAERETAPQASADNSTDPEYRSGCSVSGSVVIAHPGFYKRSREESITIWVLQDWPLFVVCQNLPRCLGMSRPAS